MYVEDEVDAVKNMLEFFVPRGFAVLIAVSAEEGFNLLKKYKPDIILVDIQLIGKSGVDFIERIQKEGNETPVIVITAYPSKMCEIEAKGLNTHGYFIKPFSFVDLYKNIKELLEIV